MTFAWYGFSLDHPEDWAPTTISGRRQEGYARVASPDVNSYQIRWQMHRKGANLRQSLDTYLQRLERDARKLRAKFTSHVEERDGGFQYQWSGSGNGKGQLLTFGDRAFFLETSSLTNRSVQSDFRNLVNSFKVQTGDTEVWSAFHLAVRIRAEMAVEKHVFQSGRTRVEWRDKVGRAVAERWGFGAQILDKHAFQDWAKSALEMQKATVKEVGDGLELEIRRPLYRAYGLAKYDELKNQVVTVKSIGRTDKGRAQWDWLI